VTGNYCWFNLDTSQGVLCRWSVFKSATVPPANWRAFRLAHLRRLNELPDSAEISSLMDRPFYAPSSVYPDSSRLAVFWLKHVVTRSMRVMLYFYISKTTWIHNATCFRMMILLSKPTMSEFYHLTTSTVPVVPPTAPVNKPRLENR
jgi:hypothetical protein